MPRPAARRNRPVWANNSKLADQNTTNAREVDERLRSEASTTHDAGIIDGLQSINSITTYASPSKEDNCSTTGLEIRRQMRSWTPIGQAQERAIESSPMGERLATGSRPPTRARGYSSTMSLAGRRGDLSSRIPGTPAFESSILSNFRKRPRQPSILQMMQADGESSDLDDDDFLGDVSPQDESTPLDRSKRNLWLFESTPVSPLLSPSKTENGRREEVEPHSQLAVAGDSLGFSPVSGSRQNKSSVYADIHEFSEPSEPLGRASAPPMSSSPPRSPLEDVSALRMGHPPNSTVERVTESITEVAEEPSQPPVRLPTAALQQRLLPRRRRRQRKYVDATDFELQRDESENDYLHSGLDDDEPNQLPPTKTSRSRINLRTKPIPSSKRAGLANQGNEKKSRMQGPGNGRNNHLRTKASSAKRTNAGGKVTYSSHSRDVGLDKENQEIDTSSPLSSSLNSDALDSDSFRSNDTSSKKFISQELQLQAMKFAEIDRWQMEFEDVTVPASQPSSLE